MKRLILAISIICGTAQAEDISVSTNRDTNVKTVVYNSDSGVIVNVSEESNVTQLILENSEVIMNTFSGFPDGYEFTVSYNTLTIRPVVYEGVDPNKDFDTNLIITTNKRTYLVYLRVSKKSASIVRYTYPNEIEAERLANIQSEQAEAIKAKPRKISCTNYNYYTDGEGSKTISPVGVCDDGSMTYIQMHKGSDTVNVYIDEEQSISNATVDSTRPNTIIVPTIARQLTLKKGRKTFTIYKSSKDTN